MFSFCCPCFLLTFLHYSMFLTAPMFQQSPPGAAAPWACPCPSMGCPWACCSPLRVVHALVWVLWGPHSLRDVPTLVWIAHGPQSLRSVPALGRGFSPPEVPPLALSTYFQEYIYSHIPNTVLFHVSPPFLLLCFISTFLWTCLFTYILMCLLPSWLHLFLNTIEQ